jgi:phage terminase large subunit-like protein
MLSTDGVPRFACPDWWERLQTGQMPMAQVPLNEAKAAKALAFFNRLKLPDVVGNPPMAEACGEWFKDILCAFLASEDPHTRRRLVWELLCMVPKKNSKTTYVAALALTALYMEEAPNRQMLLVAPSQNISERCFAQAQGMIRLDERLNKIFKVQDHLKCITRRKTGTQLDVKTFDTTIVTGEIPILTIIDELHELGKKAKAASVMQQIRGGGITMQGGQVLMITTQSDEQPAGIWKTELKKARAIRDGKGGANPIMLPVLYEYPPELQRDRRDRDGKETPAFWRDVDNWPLIMPNLGRSIDPQRLLDDYENNGKVNAEAEQIWASQHLNIEIGVGISVEGWTGADFWESATDDTLTLESLLERCDVVTLGADGGGLDDLLALAVIGRDKVTREWLAWCHAFADPKVLKRRQEIAAALRDFEAEKSLTIGDGAARHARFVAVVRQVVDSGRLPEKNAVGVDPNNAAAVFEALADGGVQPEQIKRLLQGPALAPAMYGLELKLDDGTFWHAGQKLMAWAIGNAKVEPRGNHLMITKQISGRAKIDPVIALFEAAILMSWNPAARQTIDGFLASLAATPDTSSSKSSPGA